MDEGWIWNSFDDRMNNSYVQSVKDKMKQGGTIEDKDTKKIFNSRKLALKLSTAHSDAINFGNIDDGHVEYRYLGGDNYEYKEKELSAGIGRFAHNLSLGYDKDYKKKEYAHKLQRVFNKMELWELEYKIDLIERTINIDNKKRNQISDIDMKVILKTLKDWRVKRDRLNRIYKIDHKTNLLLKGNQSYKESIIKDFHKHFKTLDNSSKAALVVIQ